MNIEASVVQTSSTHQSAVQSRRVTATSIMTRVIMPEMYGDVIDV